LPRRLLAEVVGTFSLTLVAAGGLVVGAATKGQVSDAAAAVAPGLMVMALVYALGNISGAHFNPAVTLAFALRGVFRWSRVPAYWLAQFAGALCAAGALRGMFGDVGHIGANDAGFGTTRGLAAELALTWILVMVILNTATRARVLGPNAAIAVGATIALCGLVGGPVSGASMNPARSLGPSLLARYPANWWIYVVGPLAAAVLAVAVTHALHPAVDTKEIDAAEGDRDHSLAPPTPT
jgi:aquaporin Z